MASYLCKELYVKLQTSTTHETVKHGNFDSKLTIDNLLNHRVKLVKHKIL